MTSPKIDQIIQEKSRSEHTEEAYRRVADQIGAFTVDEMRRWWAELQKREVSDNTRVHSIRIATSLLKALVEEGDEEAIKAQKWFNKINKPTETVSVMARTPLTVREIERIKRALPERRAKLAVDVLRKSGLRVSTLLSLSRQNIVHDERGWWLTFRTKRRRLVEIPVDRALCQKLLALRGDPWFRWDRKGFWRLINQTSLRVLGRKVSPHDFRRTFGTRVWNETHDMALTQQMMGHASFQTTRRYIIVSSEQMRKVAEKL